MLKIAENDNLRLAPILPDHQTNTQNNKIVLNIFNPTFRPSVRDIDIVNERQGDTIYRHPMVPGYEGFVPREHAEFGQRYTVQATEALSDFERLQNENKAAMNEIIKIGFLQDNKWDPKTLEDKEGGRYGEEQTNENGKRLIELC
ncbi:hypothetical protein HUJ05_001901 [Dendroctonus ponderosae]|nr:hypothetical protein HUJ05_001901 [Dendroctonus ponderosae]